MKYEHTLSSTTCYQPEANRRPLGQSLSQGLLNGLFLLMDMWNSYQFKRQVAQERSRLAALPDYLLQDMGIMPEEAQIESQRDFNDVPNGRG